MNQEVIEHLIINLKEVHSVNSQYLKCKVNVNNIYGKLATSYPDTYQSTEDKIAKLSNRTKTRKIYDDLIRERGDIKNKFFELVEDQHTILEQVGSILFDLYKQLAQSILDENYEESAILRNEIINYSL